MKCRNCGHINGPNTRFCNNCGSPLGNASSSRPRQNYPNRSGYSSNRGYPPQGYGPNQPGYNPNGQYAPKKRGPSVAMIILGVVVAIGLIGVLFFVFVKIGEYTSKANLAQEIIGTWKPANYDGYDIKLNFENGSQMSLSSEGPYYGYDAKAEVSGTYSLDGNRITMTFNKINFNGMTFDYDTLKDRIDYDFPETIEADVSITDNTLNLTNESVRGTQGSQMGDELGFNGEDQFVRSSDS